MNSNKTNNKTLNFKNKGRRPVLGMGMGINVSQLPDNNNNKRQQRNNKIIKINDVIKFIETKFITKIPERKGYVYKKIIIYHKYYPKIIEELIDNLHLIGSWKDYINLLTYCHKYKHMNINTTNIDTCANMLTANNTLITTPLEDYIYKILAKTLNRDIMLMNIKRYKRITSFKDIENLDYRNIDKSNREQYISTLVKYLPSEKSKLNKNINFIDNLTKYVYNKNNDTVIGIRTYNYTNNCNKLKNILGLGNYLGALIKSGQIDKVIFAKLPRSVIKMNLKLIEMEPALLIKYRKYLHDTYRTYDLTKLINILFHSDKLDDYHKEAIKNTWISCPDYYKTFSQLYKINLNVHATIFVELSNNIFSDNKMYKFIVTAILLSEHYGNEIYTLSGKKIIFDNDCLFDMIKKIKEYLGPKTVDFDKFIKPDTSAIVFINSNNNVNNNIKKNVTTVILSKDNVMTITKDLKIVSIYPKPTNNYEVLQFITQKYKKSSNYKLLLLFVILFVMFVVYYFFC